MRDLRDVVQDNINRNGNISWTGVAQELGGNPEVWRSRWRREMQKELFPVGLKRRVKDIGTERIENLRREGYNIEVWFENGELWCENKPFLKMGVGETLAPLSVGDTITIAILGDTHIGSIYSDGEALRTFYQYAIERGVREFYHTGDITDGMYKNRDDSFYEQDKHGFQEQMEKVVRDYPRAEGVTTYFITGNHDVTHLRNGGADIGRTIEMARPDMVYLGHNFAKVWLSDAIDLNLVHPTDGGAMAVTHKIQRIIDSAEGPRRSQILAVGHYHKMAWVYWKGTHGFVVPSFQRQTPFMASNNLLSYIGGYILTIKMGPYGELLSVTPEFVDLADR